MFWAADEESIQQTHVLTKSMRDKDDVWQQAVLAADRTGSETWENVLLHSRISYYESRKLVTGYRHATGSRGLWESEMLAFEAGVAAAVDSWYFGMERSSDDGMRDMSERKGAKKSSDRHTSAALAGAFPERSFRASTAKPYESSTTSTSSHLC